MKNLKERIRDKYEHGGLVQLVPPFPKKNMLIEVTNFCNHQCVFCANSKMIRKRGFIEPNFIYRILDEAYRLGMKEAGFYATGEPLMNPHIFSYIAKAKAIGYDYVYITTNGALLDEEKMEMLICSKLDSIKFSINAGTRDTYQLIHGKNDFEKVIANVKRLSALRRERNKDLKVYVSSVVTNRSIDEREELQKLLRNDVDEFLFVNVGNQGGLMYKENRYLAIGNKLQGHDKCYLPFNSITITHEGYLTACCTDFENYLVIADLNKVSLKEAWESEKFQKLREMHIKKEYGQTMCNNCLNMKDDAIIPL